MAKHIKALTSLRGVTAISIVIHHYSLLFIYLGTISYSTYMVCWFLQKSISLIYKSIFHVNFRTNLSIYNSVIILILYSLIVTLAALLTYKFVELKVQHYSKTLRFAKRYVFCGN